jgi:hypothetical protein
MKKRTAQQLRRGKGREEREREQNKESTQPDFGEQCVALTQL